MTSLYIYSLSHPSFNNFETNNLFVTIIISFIPLFKHFNITSSPFDIEPRYKHLSSFPSHLDVCFGLIFAMANTKKTSRGTLHSHCTLSSNYIVSQRKLCSFQYIDSLQFFPSTYSVGRLLREMCLTTPECIPKDLDGAAYFCGKFESALQQMIDDWRKQSFNAYLVDIRIWPQTSYEPSYCRTTDFSHEIKFFNVISESGLLFPGIILQPFRRIWGNNLQTRINDKWVPVDRWLKSWLRISELTMYDPIQYFFERYCQFAGMRNLFSSLPVELRWMIYDLLIDDAGFCKLPEKGHQPSFKRTRPQFTRTTFKIWAGLPVSILSMRPYWELCNDWDLARDFTQYLLRNTAIEFRKHSDLQHFMEKAPFHVLHYVRHVKFCFEEGLESIFDFLAAPGCRSTPDWSIAALAHLPSLMEIEIFIHPDPETCKRFIEWHNGCRALYVNHLLEAMFPWIALHGVDVIFTGAIRSSQRTRFNSLLTQAQELAASEPPRRVLTELVRTQVRAAFAKYKGMNPTHWRIRSPMDEEQTLIRRQKMKAFENARAQFGKICWALVTGSPRYHVNDNSITCKRPSRRKQDILIFDM